MQNHSFAVSADPVFDAGFSPVRFGRLGSLIRHVLAVARQRRQLAGLTRRQLADVGLTQAEAMAEAERPFWDLPARQR